MGAAAAAGATTAGLGAAYPGPGGRGCPVDTSASAAIPCADSGGAVAGAKGEPGDAAAGETAGGDRFP
jgi:hypothetical protein